MLMYVSNRKKTENVPLKLCGGVHIISSRNHRELFAITCTNSCHFVLALAMIRKSGYLRKGAKRSPERVQ